METQVTTAPMKRIFHNKKVLRPIEHELFTGWEPDPEFSVVEQEPKFTWRGAKIPFEVWEQVAAFMRWSQGKYKQEAMIFLFYRPESREWAAWAFPQQPSGMTVKMLPDNPLYAEDRQRFGAGWIQCGTVHHHCTMGAFQSGTDTEDESDRDGLHVTLGKLDEHRMDLHCRQIFGGVQSTTSLLAWVDLPEFLRNAPGYCRYDLALHAMLTVDKAEFPEEWKDRIIPYVYTQPTNFPGGSGGADTKAAATAPTIPSRGSGPEGHISDFKIKQRLAARGVCAQLGLTIEGARRLIGSFDMKDKEEKDTLQSELLKAGIMWIHQADLIKEIHDEEVAANTEMLGGY